MSGGAVIVVTPDELRALVRDAVREALAERGEGDAAEWLDARAVAKLLGVNARTVQKLAVRGGLPAHRFGSKLLRYRRVDVERWSEEQGRARAAR